MDKGLHGRKDRLIKQKRHDSYREREKWPEPTLCNHCNALYVNGRWCWKETSVDPYHTVCPACQRSADDYPAGYIEMTGDFFSDRRDEILNMVTNVEKQEKNAHPLERIMKISDDKGQTTITTTGVHIARRIGEALSHSYKGDYSFQYATGEKRIRVYWKR